MAMIHRSLLIVLTLSVVGCGKAPSNDVPAASQQALIHGELTPSSYREAAATVLAQAIAAMSDPAVTEQTLDKSVAQIETLMGLESKLSVDKSQLSDAELMSTLGALYTRRAGLHPDNTEQASALASAGFRYLDRAISKYPNNITARINRGLTCASVPEFMNKTDVARDDLRWVVDSAEFATLTPEVQARVKATLQEVEKRLGRGASRN